MKMKKFLSWALTAALSLSLFAMPAAAASFPDVVGHWAEKAIDDAVAQKIFVGDNGKFYPDREITASEVLATCARITVEQELRTDISAGPKGEQVKTLMGDKQSWFHSEYAVCLETGIVTYPELKELFQSGALSKSIAKEDFALYLTRAMQLEPMAKSLTTYNLDFKDKAAIATGREPYIYVLNRYGIITGTDTGDFQPGSFVNRAVASTMLTRAVAFMEENGTNVELPEYTDYEWEAGTIVSATAGSKGVILLTLKSDFSDAKTISISTETPIYENSMLVDQSLLKPGVYARVNLDEKDSAINVRLSGSVQTITGNVVGVSEEAILLDVNGTTQTLGYDRFTAVQVGGKVGGRTLIDLDAGYAGATCRIDQLGHMVALQLTGGTREAEGIISSVSSIATGGTSLVISGLNGQPQKFTIPAGTAVTVNGLAMASVDSSYVGSYISMRVYNDNPNTVAVAKVDNVTRYHQGAVKAAGTDNGVNTVTLTDLTTNKATTYKVAENATFTYNGASVTHGGVQKDWFVTIRLSGGELSALWGYQGSVITEGTISGISYPSGTSKQIISVTKKADGTVAPFELELTNPPEVRRGGKTSTLDKLSTGDVVKVTVRYGQVTLVEATPQSANLAGTIQELSQTTSGVTIKVELDGNGGTNTYAVGSDVTITQNGKVISMYDLRVGYHVAMVANGDQVASIEVDKVASTSNELTGTVITVNTTDKTILFRALDSGGTEKIVTVSVPIGTTIQDVTGGGATSLSKLQTGYTLSIYGSYVNDQFKATLVVRK